MCGIYGIVSFTGEGVEAACLADMGRSLGHRGPDSRGLEQCRRFALGSERLRVVDLRAEADQPFRHSESGLTLVCNGEIYNSKELRKRYGGYPFRSRSDVEVILPLFIDRGVEGLEDLDGMFAIAIWDEKRSSLTLARDRAGEKPLFYLETSSSICFASEIQTLLLHPSASRELDEVAISEYMQLGYIPEPRSPFRAIRKIGAGTAKVFSPAGVSEFRFWDPSGVEVEPIGDSEATTRLDNLLVSAVRKQLAADVPVGLFLSGGIDSSLIAALASENAARGSLYTLSARFSENSYDESGAAAVISRRLGTEHHEVVIDEDSMTDALRGVVEGLAEPLADPAILPTFILARKAREHVTVILSGEGADELFGGYPTYLGHRLAPYLLKSPRVSRRLFRMVVDRLPASRKKVTIDFLLRRFLDGLERPWPDRHFAWFGPDAGKLLRGDIPSADLRRFANPGERGSVGEATLLDYRTYLRDNLLVKNDRATMMHSLEARAPFLDVDVSRFALSLPEHLKVRGLTTKWLLKQVAKAWLPSDVIHRRKRGLSVPIASWIDAGLRSEVDRLLEADRIEDQGLFDSNRVQAMLTEHRDRKANHAKPLWTLIMLQYWLERWS